MKSRKYFILLLTLSIVACSGAAKQTVSENIDYLTFEKMRTQKDVIVLDVRAPEETAKGMIPEAVELDFYSDSFDEELSKLDKSKTYLVYCRSGNRSGQTLEKMKALKFKSAFHLVGGYTKWIKENEQ